METDQEKKEVTWIIMMSTHVLVMISQTDFLRH